MIDGKRKRTPNRVLLREIASILGSEEWIETISVFPSNRPDSVVVSLLDEHYPEEYVSEAYIEVQSYVNGDFHITYVEDHFGEEWMCRWDRHESERYSMNSFLYLTNCPYRGLLGLFKVPTIPAALHPAVDVAVVVFDTRDAQRVLEKSHTRQISRRPENGFPFCMCTRYSPSGHNRKLRTSSLLTSLFKTLYVDRRGNPSSTAISCVIYDLNDSITS